MTTIETPSAKRRPWSSVVIAAALVVVIVALAMGASAVIFFYRHTNSTATTAAEAGREFERARTRFDGQRPLVEMTGGTFVRYPTPDAPRQPVTAVHVLSYDTEEGQLTRIDVPGWSLRLVPSLSGISLFEKLEATSGSSLQLTLEDIERHGPGLILDMRHPEVQALAWTE